MYEWYYKTSDGDVATRIIPLAFERLLMKAINQNCYFLV